MNETIDYILLGGIILTFTGTLITILYTRRNIETTKYIDTVTSGRIRWIDIVRDEATSLVTNILFTLDYYSSKPKKTHSSSPFGKTKDPWSINDYICFLYIFKLRLNPKEDKKIVKIINYFIDFYKNEEYKSASKRKIAYENVEVFFKLTRDILNNEWQKIKKESRGEIE